MKSVHICKGKSDALALFLQSTYIACMNGQQLKDWRRAQGLSQATLAEQLGVSRRTIINWEAGSPVEHDTMQSLACKQLEHAQRNQKTSTA